MTVDDVESTAASRHGAYLCLTVPPGERRAAASLPADMLAGSHPASGRMRQLITSTRQLPRPTRRTDWFRARLCEGST